MEPTNSTSSRLMAIALVVAISLLALAASKIVSASHGPTSDYFYEGTGSGEEDIGASADANTSNNNAAIFTSMEAEFEWNQLMAPDYDPGRIDSIERTRNSGRRLLNKDVLSYGTLRGQRIGD